MKTKVNNAKRMGHGGVTAQAALRDAHRFLLNTYKRAPIVFVRAKGCTIVDADGKKYLDFLGGIAVNALGHGHPRIVRTIRREAGRAIHFSNLYHHLWQGPLGRKLASWSGMDRVFFTNSGTEAIEGALKLARLYTRRQNGGSRASGKPGILALDNSFHGRTFGALSITSTRKYREPFEPLLPGVQFVCFNDVADLEAKFDATIGAVVIEPLQGEGGIHAVSDAFWNRARELATQHGAALVADEIQCGLGRTGRYFAYQRFAARPDIVVVAKPLAGGLPLGAVLVNDAIASAVSPGVHGTTFGGGPLTCAVALEFLKTVDEEKLLGKIQERGRELRAGLIKLQRKFDFIREVRGEGLMVGVELSIEGAPFVTEALRSGVLINCTHDYVLRFLPPFTVTSREIGQFLSKLETVFAKTPRTALLPAMNSSAVAKARALAVAR
ncbi:MAG TPA: aspartate aminotransferase family protein [Candidatus Dormibacteraeota bacterium]|nr:aspartate aminotransferase family protein [Candidatus Dormibacteraeota bacterium]